MKINNKLQVKVKDFEAKLQYQKIGREKKDKSL
jgi:hypothetical protein